MLTDVTGPASSGNKSVVDGVKAGVYYADRNGYTIKYVVADGATNPTTTLAAAQKLVTQNHAIAVVAQATLAFSAAPYLTAHGVPVVGISEDGPEWVTSKNMFSVSGALQPTQVTTTAGKFWKAQGVTNLASLGYGISPISSEQASSAAMSAEAAGVKVGYLNAKYPYGSTDVGPTVLAMKDAKVDGFTATMEPNVAFAMLTALKQQGVSLKAALLPTGYGGDLTDAGPGAISAAQGVDFSLGYQPLEMQTAATKQFQADLKSAGITRTASFGTYNGYASVALLVEGLKKAGANPTQKTLLAGLTNVHDFNAAGLYGDVKLDINDRTATHTLNCLWMVKLVGQKFELVSGADPVCGSVIPGKTVAAAQ
ncbi:ABC transporter substrate-binding protein [Pseudofrankia inefficax]|uniref:ABC transporter substrate-binding protein n=1 Tax=Pseudofrankia inefficax (strain DSM 45817 / CECT 9037 / DDB 130130 / EuI1c) TaxID=298654 RepID=UPI00032565F3|nr:ABC transporter substrate-binding protein [Pseudofrankia inefficax]